MGFRQISSSRRVALRLSGSATAKAHATLDHRLRAFGNEIIHCHAAGIVPSKGERNGAARSLPCAADEGDLPAEIERIRADHAPSPLMTISTSVLMPPLPSR